MRIDQKVLLIMKYLSNEKNEIEGKILLQKCIYFVNELLKLDIKFEPYYYGPYSSEVTFAIEEMKNTGIINEEIEKYIADSWLMKYEPRLFKYNLTEFGSNLADVIEKCYTKEAENIRKAIEKIKEASKNTSKILSIAGKMYLILKLEDRPKNYKEIISEAEYMNWHIKEEEAKKAIDFLNEIEIVERT